MLYIAAFLLLLSIKHSQATTTQNYTVSKGGEAAVIWPYILNRTYTVTADEPLAVYAGTTSIGDTGTLIYEGDGPNTVFLGSLNSLVADGVFGMTKPYLSNSTTLTVAVGNILGAGFILVRVASDIQNMDYSVLWYTGNHGEVINITSITGPKVVAIASQVSTFIEDLSFSSPETTMDWLPTTLLPPQKPIATFRRVEEGQRLLTEELLGTATVVVSNGTATLNLSSTIPDYNDIIPGDFCYLPTAHYPFMAVIQSMPTWQVQTKNLNIITMKVIVLDNDPRGNFTVQNTVNGQDLQYFISSGSLIVSAQKILIFYRCPINVNCTGGVIKVEFFEPAVNNCNFEGHGYGDSCIVETYLASTYDEALDACNFNNGSLPVLSNSTEDQLLQSTLTKTFLMPYSETDNADLWLNWKDGHWVGGASNYSRYTGNGMQIPLITWSSIGSLGTGQNLRPEPVPSVNTGQIQCPPALVLCPPGGVSTVPTDTNMAFIAADAVCKTSDHKFITLPKVQNSQQNELVYSFARKNLGTSMEYVWLNQGGNTTICGQWNDGETMLYNRYYDSEEWTNCQNVSMCLTMLLTTEDAGKWKYLDCQSTQEIGTICSANMTTNTPLN